MSFILSHETGMLVSRLVDHIDENGDLKIRVHWRGLPKSSDTWEPLQQVCEYVPRLVRLILNRWNTPASLRERATSALSL